ncbi:Co-chaperone GroES [Aphelenchoides fujianensis]|nr:Co-chaperone GroES [Aphelenchoides fujianensis]
MWSAIPFSSYNPNPPLTSSPPEAFAVLDRPGGNRASGFDDRRNQQGRWNGAANSQQAAARRRPLCAGKSGAQLNDEELFPSIPNRFEAYGQDSPPDYQWAREEERPRENGDFHEQPDGRPMDRGRRDEEWANEDVHGDERFEQPRQPARPPALRRAVRAREPRGVRSAAPSAGRLQRDAPAVSTRPRPSDRRERSGTSAIGRQVARRPPTHRRLLQPFVRFTPGRAALCVERVSMAGAQHVFPDGRPLGLEFEGVVVAVGPGRVDQHNVEQPPLYRVGERVMLQRAHGHRYAEGGQEYEVFFETEILGKFEM